MPTPPTDQYCPTNRQKLAQVQALLQEYDRALTTAIATGDFRIVETLQTTLTKQLNDLEKVSNPFEKLLNLTEQYNQQLTILRELTDEHNEPLLIKHPETGQEGIEGIDGRFYPIPSQQEILIAMIEQVDTFRLKISQGFSLFTLIPFGLSLNRLAQAYGRLLRKKHERGELLDSTGQPMYLSPTEQELFEIQYKLLQLDQVI